MATDAQICSLALTRIGHEGITALSASGNKAQKWFAANYDFIRQTLIREHPWRFAIKRDELTKEDVADPTEFSYRFEIPSDCLRVLRVNSREWDTYRVEAGYIYTNEGEVWIEYIFDNDDESTFDSQFVDLLAARLSAEVCFYLTDNSTLTEQAWNIYNNKLTMARSLDSMQGTPRGLEADTWLGARV